jgi:hypothetical protein
MNAAQIESFMMQYLQATNCHIIEKGLGYVTVKLSPQADKDLTQRNYYWSFVERTGAAPETMTYSLVFDPLNNGLVEAPIVTAPGGLTASMRVQRHEVNFGSRRLDQVFQAVHNKGRWINLFENPPSNPVRGQASVGYGTWLGINYTIEFTCDMKRSEIHSLGISLNTGEIVESFHLLLKKKKLSPRLPLNVHLQPKQMTLQKAAALAEQFIENKLKQYDHCWAVEARERLKVEMSRMDDYYVDLIASVEEEKKQELTEQYQNRQQEINWQYDPRIKASAFNCGFFHLKIPAPPNN